MTKRAADILRIAVLIRDGYTCVYCGAVRGQRALINGRRARVAITLDHVTPKAWGGRDVPRNMVACCARCNTIKATMDAEAFAFMMKRHGLIRTRRELTRRVAAAVAKPINLLAAAAVYAQK